MAMTPVIMGAFHKARQGVDTAFAILFEVIRTLNTFQPAVILELCQYKEKSRNPLLIITKFATSSNQNLKYLGISMLCQVRPDAWSDTWWNEDLLSAVVQALDSRDATIQRKALDLLYRMLTIDNSENIIDRLVYAFYQEQDEYASTENNKSNNGSNGRSRGEQYPSRREKILDQILDAGERFAVQKTMELLAEKEYSLTTSTLASEKDKVTSTLPLAYFATWILGEYGDIADDGSISTILEVLVRCLLINQAFIFTALTKITLKSKNGIPANIAAVVRAHILSWNTTSSSFSSSYVVDTQYRAQEFLMIAELTSNVAT
ncbi:AP-4 complex subunit epsilon-1 [Lobosporangium transversale]|nr:AP-4 complex subunit epsilon-1 [Lobosporangium transversale]